MTFGKTRFSKKYQYELIRFCTKKNLNIPGGASKLLRHFEKLHEPKSIVSYTNRRWSASGLYEALNFTHSHDSSPNYFYFKNGSTHLESRNQYQKHKLNDKLEVFDSQKTESENMFMNKYRRIYDSGNKVYFKKYSKN